MTAEMVTFTKKCMKLLLKIFALSVVLFTIIFGCRDDEILNDENAVLDFSTDTVYFDTVLVSLGSVTNYFKIYNRYDQPLEIDRIYLAMGDKSFFRLNVDGIEGNDLKNIRIARKDSIFVFVEVTIDPLNENNPLLIKDSVVCILNNNQQDVKLIAYGQDAVVFNNEIFQTQTWTSEKPYLIVNNAAIDSNEVLTIEPGAHIYLTEQSSLIVWGHVEALGTLEEPIIFSGARFDGRYEESAGQWGTIFIHQRSTGNILQNVIIRNAQAGLQIGYPDPNSSNSIELRNCMILNSGIAGILAFKANLNAYNTVIADCGSFAISIEMGGTYNFYHCTVSNYSAYYPGFYEGGYKPFRLYPSVIYTNYRDWFDYDDDYRIVEVTYPGDLELNFVNSIINGNKDIEVYFDSLVTAGFEYKFDHCLLKLNEDSLHHFDTTKFISVLLNDSVHFINDNRALGDYDFRLDSNSAAIDAGSIELLQGIPQLESDFNGNPRTTDGHPDLGAYERIE
jgi:hypothetical protein